jgi:hypothetical protein
MVLPRFSCPICGSRVHLTDIEEWGAEDGEIVQAAFECETEPDIDSDEWREWHRGHYSMPYVDWLPWEVRVLEWLNRHYRYDGGG